MIFYEFEKKYEWILDDISLLYSVDLKNGIFRSRSIRILRYYYKRYLSAFGNKKDIFLYDYEKRCIDVVESNEITDFLQLIYFGIAFVALNYDEYPNDYSFEYSNLLHIAMYCFSRIKLTESVAFRRCAKLIEYTEANNQFVGNDKRDYGIVNKLYVFAKQLFFQYDPNSHKSLEYYVKLLGFPNND